MKKIILSILMLSLFTLSCESDDDGITYTTPDYISGKWIFKKIGTVNSQTVLIYQDYPNEATCEADNIVINQDGTFALNDFTTQGTTCVNQGISGNYSLVNKDLTLSYTIENVQYEEVLTIVSLTYDEVTLTGSDDLGQVVFYKLSR